MFFLTTVIRPPYSLTSSNCIEAIFIHFVLKTHLTLPEFPLIALPSELAALLLPRWSMSHSTLLPKLNRGLLVFPTAW